MTKKKNEGKNDKNRRIRKQQSQIKEILTIVTLSLNEINRRNVKQKATLEKKAQNQIEIKIYYSLDKEVWRS